MPRHDARAQDAGYDITIASPRGGAVPVDAASLAPDVKGPESERMLTDGARALTRLQRCVASPSAFSHAARTHHLLPADEAKLVLQHSVPLSDIISDATYYDVVFLPGGHGPCFDLAADTMLADILTRANGAGDGWRAARTHGCSAGCVRCLSALRARVTASPKRAASHAGRLLLPPPPQAS